MAKLFAKEHSEFPEPPLVSRASAHQTLDTDRSQQLFVQASARLRYFFTPVTLEDIRDISPSIPCSLPVFSKKQWATVEVSQAMDVMR